VTFDCNEKLKENKQENVGEENRKNSRYCLLPIFLSHIFLFVLLFSFESG